MENATIHGTFSIEHSLVSGDGSVGRWEARPVVHDLVLQARDLVVWMVRVKFMRIEFRLVGGIWSRFR
jgi:hypothetical protein